MVESKSTQGDGVRRDVIYAKWREDLPAEPGYSKELVSVELDPKYYDAINTMPSVVPGCLTFLDFFERQVRLRPNAPYLGTRKKLSETQYGDFQWLSFIQVEEMAQKVARGIKRLDLAVETEGDGKKWQFVGIWSKNRYEWLVTHIANMYYTMTTIGFFDSMGF